MAKMASRCTSPPLPSKIATGSRNWAVVTHRRIGYIASQRQSVAASAAPEASSWPGGFVPAFACTEIKYKFNIYISKSWRVESRHNIFTDITPRALLSGSRYLTGAVCQKDVQLLRWAELDEVLLSIVSKNSIKLRALRPTTPISAYPEGCLSK